MGGGMEFERGIFEQAVEEDDELSHHRAQGDHFLFAGGEEPLVEGFEDRGWRSCSSDRDRNSFRRSPLRAETHGCPPSGC